MRKFLVVLVLFIGAVFVIFSFSELEHTVATLQQGKLLYLFLAFLIQIGWFFLIGITYRSLYRLLGMKESIMNLTKIAVAATFVNVIMPTAGVGGIAIFVNSAKKNGHPTGKVTLAAALFVLFDYAAFLAVLALGWIVLIRRNDLNAGEITASLILLIIALILTFTLYLGSRSANAMGNFLASLARMVNFILRPIIRRNYLQEERAHAFAQEMADGLSSLPNRPRGLLKPLFLAFLNKGLLICILLCSFLAFQVPFSGGTIIGGFAIGYLFVIVSPTPSGIGVVEGALPLALKSLRVIWSQAVIITIAYRAMTFWVPLGVGAWAFRNLHVGKDETASNGRDVNLMAEPRHYRVTKEYQSPYPEPIIFHKGEKVSISKEFTDDPDWKNWVWCEGQNNNEAWVPKQYLEIKGNTGTFLIDYNALELSVVVGEVLNIHETVNGFGMAEKQNGERGWVPLKNLRGEAK